MKISLGFSPCPNDTFIFDALVNKKIETAGYEFEIFLEDVQTLNFRALQNTLDFTKISYGVLPLVLNEYVLLSSGGALGKGVGPLLISNSQFKIDDINNAHIAIPGKNTTAHILFSLAFPGAKNKVFARYDKIENLVLSNKADAGVIIHENRFTYQAKGLHKILDLGEYWEEKTNLPIPLGGIVAKRTLEKSLIKKVDDLIKQSIEYAYKNYENHLSDFVKQHSQEMSEEVMRQHIDLYVNGYSIDLGDEGKKAIRKFLEIYNQMNSNPQTTFKHIYI